VPRENGIKAVRAVLDLIARESFVIPFPLEVRWVAGDDAHLSPAHGRDTTYVAVHMFEGMAYEQYFRAVEEVLGELGGRPHWGKRHFRDAEFLRERYPEWDAFQAVRAELDPDGRFANAYVKRVLGEAPVLSR
jgi:L-gulono-1,4-lactone dehydrogenase